MTAALDADTLAGLAPLDGLSAYVPLRIAVLTALRGAILDGHLRPGVLLSENRIAARLAVSRTPVREALRALEQEALVTTLPGRRIIVSIPDPRDIREVYDIRWIVESEAIRRITIGNAALVARLEDSVARSRTALAAGDLQGVKQTNAEFHGTLISALDNRRLSQYLDSVHDTIARLRLYSLAEGDWAREGIEEHAGLAALLASGRTSSALELLRRHLETARDILTRMFEAGADTAAPRP